MSERPPLPLAARNAAIVAAYRAQPDLSQRELAAAFGLTPSTVGRVLAKARATDPERARIVRHRRYIEGRFRPGRKAVWPDCPPNLRREYMRLRDSMGIPALEARRLLDPEFQA